MGLTEEGGGPSLLSIERRMLDRLANPPRYQLFDGSIVLCELAEVVADLDRSGSSAEGELVFYPSSQVMQSDFPALTSGTVQADDKEFKVTVRIDTPKEQRYFRHGGILQFVLRDLLAT